MAEVETVASGLGLLEGPVWRPRTADLIITVVGSGWVLRVDPGTGQADRLAETKGGPNGAFPCEDGGVLITQNGGLNWDAIGIPNSAPGEPTTPGIQRVGADGTVALLTEGDGPFHAPNDLFGTDEGTIWFTDPPEFPPPPDPVGRVWKWAPGRRPEVFASDFAYCNGIGVDRLGTVVVVEHRGLMEIHGDGSRRWLVESLPSGGDGFAFDIEGNLYVAGGRHITVVSPEGSVLDQLSAPPGRAMVTNCCFGGDDLRTLFATDGGSGRVLAFASMPVPGLALKPWDGSR